MTTLDRIDDGRWREATERAGATVLDRRDAPVSSIPTRSHQIRFRQSKDHASPVSKIPRQNARVSLRPQARGRGVRQLSRRAGAKKRRLDLPSAH